MQAGLSLPVTGNCNCIHSCHLFPVSVTYCCFEGVCALVYVYCCKSELVDEAAISPKVYISDNFGTVFLQPARLQQMREEEQVSIRLQFQASLG